MATYYVSPYGSDSNTGTGPGASAAKLTLGGGFVLLTAGDRLEVCPGTYVLSAAITPQTVASETIINADYTNASGFTDGSGVRVPAGRVLVTNRTATKWQTTTGNYFFTLASRSNYTFQGFDFEIAHAVQMFSLSGTTANTTIRDCLFLYNTTGAGYALYINLNAGVTANLLIERCVVIGDRVNSNGTFGLTIARHTADYDKAITFKNCFIFGHSSNSDLYVASNGSGAGYGGGVVAINCTQIGGSTGFLRTVDAYLSTTYPCKAYNNFIMPQSTATALNANTAGQIVENNNWIIASTARSGITSTGANSVDVSAPMQYQMLPALGLRSGRLGDLRELFGMTKDGATMFAGWGDDSGGLAPTTDVFGFPRPCGGGNSNSNVLSGVTASSGATGSITSTGAGWTADVYIGQVVSITSGTGSGQRRRIYDNTTDTLSVAPNWATTPDATSVFSVVNPGSLISIGAIEPVGCSIYRETSTVRTGAAALGMYGPDVHRAFIPVDAVSTTLSTYVQWNANYGGSNKPQMKIMANLAIGVTEATVTATGSSGSWEQLASSPFTPTAKGVVEVRLISRDTNGYGNCLWDDLQRA